LLRALLMADQLPACVWVCALRGQALAHDPHPMHASIAMLSM